MNKFIQDLKGSAWNSTWGRIGLAIGVPASLIGQYVGAVEGFIFATVLGLPALLVAFILDKKKPIER